MTSDYERLGGEDGLRHIVTDFVDRVMSDFVIGFFFEGKDRDRIVQHELELASTHLGGPHRYKGRPVAPLHRRLPINRGHFRRRLAILRTVLAEHDAPADVIEHWVEHDRKMEQVITNGQECLP